MSYIELIICRKAFIGRSHQSKLDISVNVLISLEFHPNMWLLPTEDEAIASLGFVRLSHLIFTCKHLYYSEVPNNSVHVGIGGIPGPHSLIIGYQM